MKDFYLALARAEEVGILDRQLTEISYGAPVEHAGPAARFGLNEHRARGFLSRARRRYAGVLSPGQGDGADQDESWALGPAWDLDTILGEQTGHVEDLVDEASQVARAIMCTNPQVRLALAVVGPPGEDWVYQWQLTSSPA